ncbi:hypothetical protein XENOCAPTIV_011810, partial [Xenoophorus captivus]
IKIFFLSATCFFAVQYAQQWQQYYQNQNQWNQYYSQYGGYPGQGSQGSSSGKEKSQCLKPQSQTSKNVTTMKSIYSCCYSTAKSLISSTALRRSFDTNAAAPAGIGPSKKRSLQSGSRLLSLCRCSSSSLSCRKETGMEQPLLRCGSVMAWNVKQIYKLELF